MVGFSGLDSVRAKRDQPPPLRRRRCPRRIAKPRTLTCAHMYLSRRVSESGSACTYGGKAGGAEGDRMYLRDREPARTLPVICGPYQMRPKSFHHSLAPRRAYSAFSPFARSLFLSFILYLSLSGSFFPSAPPVLYSTWPAGISPFRAEIPSFDSFTTTTTSVISNNVPAGGSFFNRHSNPEHAGEILVRVYTLRTRRS